MRSVAHLGLFYHPHIHFLVTGGGQAPHGAWQPCHNKFLVPVRELSKVFRARFRDALKEALPEVFATIPATVWASDWVVHSKSVGSGEKALLYLSRYIYRVALADRHILSVDDRGVCFSYRSSEDGRRQTSIVDPLEFLRLFLQHVLPSRFVKVRHFGLHHSSRRSTLSLMRASLCLNLKLPLPLPPAPPSPRLFLCPKCATPMCVVELIRKPYLPRPRGPPDTTSP